MKKTRWRNRKGAGLLALALTLALAFSVTGALESRAAIAVDTDKEDCTLTVNASELEMTVDKDYQNKYDGTPLEAKPDEVKLDIALYRVAAVDAGGKYTALSYAADAMVVMDGKERGTFGDIVSVVNSDTAQSDWLDMAEAVASVVDNAPDDEKFGPLTASKGNGVEPEYEVKFEDLKTGLYLIVPEQVETPYYVYNFTPYLISLPNNFYQDTGDDGWVYHALSYPKMESVPREGKLEIKKNLSSMNGTPGNTAAFVFEVTIDPLKGDIENQFIMMEFNGTGWETETVEGIPAGSTVTVEEVYSGSGYQLADGDDGFWKGIVGANDYSASATSALSIDFRNESDGTTAGGSGIRNHFYMDENGEYQHKKPDSSQNGQTE